MTMPNDLTTHLEYRGGCYDPEPDPREWCGETGCLNFGTLVCAMCRALDRERDCYCPEHFDQASGLCCFCTGAKRENGY